MRIRAFFCFLVLASALGVTDGLRAAELPEGFRLEPVVGGLTDPTSLAQTPDGRILITERTTGNLRQVRHGELQAAPLCSTSVATTGEAGLLGVTVHPDFSHNGWIYLYYTDLATGQNKVSRYTIEGDDCGGATDIISGLPAGPGFLRNGGGLGFGPDGKLYVTTGDMEDPGSGQDAGVLEGKVLRINDDGSTPADNPTGGSLVYAKGVRDGRGVSVHPAGQVYLADRGDAVAHDEVNLATAGGNLGWDAETGAGGSFDDPLVAWTPSTGLGALVTYTKDAFPDLAADGIDNDHDAYGPDHRPGAAFVDDNGVGRCVGSQVQGSACTVFTDCEPVRTGESRFCWVNDEADEYCLGGDDGCAAGATGVDEPDESYLNSVFVVAGDTIRREVLVGAGLDTLNSSQVFLDSTALGDCPTSWTGLTAGDDGFLYALAANGGGAAGALYRIVHDPAPAGPREVSKPGSPFPLRVDKTTLANRVRVYWEDLRENSMQVQGTPPTGRTREYTVWSGELGNYYSHSPVTGLDATEGTLINDAYRRAQVAIDETQSYYFLVSGRHDNLEGTLGAGASGERSGYATTDLCDTIGYWPATLGECVPDFTLISEHGEEVSLYDYRGQSVLLDFSARWCPPCITQADVMQAFYEEFEHRETEFLTIMMDETSQSQDWDGRPTVEECIIWNDRSPGGPSAGDHRFLCLADPVSCPDSVTGPCSGLNGPVTQQVWPVYSTGSLPTNVVIDPGLRIVYRNAGYGEAAIRNTLNNIYGASSDSCLH